MFWNGRHPVAADRGTVDSILSRGIANVVPAELARKKLSSGERLRIYFGIDPTGAQLHLGHSVPLRKLKALSDAGHHVIFLVGSFTAMIGDPTGRDAAREPLTKEKVEENFRTYKRQAQKILDFSKVEVRYNAEWLAPLTLAGLVKLASNFTVGQMLERDMFQRRIKEGKPVGLHEFLYPLMVGYDSAMLDVDCELGGSDQEFNMLAGRSLQQALGKRDKFVLATRLIEGTDGRKMSKTYNNCIYLDDTASDMYGKTMSIKDELVGLYLETCTDVPMAEVQEILKSHPKEAKMRLAREIAALYHGKNEAEKAEKNFTQVFSNKKAPEEAQEVTFLTSLMETLVTAGIVESNSQYRRLQEAGAIRFADTDETVVPESVVIGKVLRVGKHRFVKIIKK